MKKILLISSALVFSLFFAATASAATPNWDITGTWALDYHYINGENWHDWFTTSFDCETGAITGNGGYPLGGPYTYAWTITSGSVNGDTVEFYANYTSGAVCSFHLIGTIAGNGLSMSGTWDDNCNGDRVGTFTATGVAAPADCDQDGSPNSLDCNDSDATIYPGAADSACNGVDNDCDLAIDEDYVNTPTICGIGECAAAGEMTCVAGAEVDTCTAGTPVAEICDGLDNDCDATTDEDLTAPFANMQQGVCVGSVKICAGTSGWIEPNYALVPYYETTETRCDTLDNNCNGEADEGGICEYSCFGTPTVDSPDVELGVNRLIYNGTNWITKTPKGKEIKATNITLADTHNCSCEQMLTWLHNNLPEMYGEMNGHWKYGCSQSVVQDFMRLTTNPTFTATESFYYNGPTDSYPLYGSGPIVFTWNQITGQVTGGYYTEQVPAYTGTYYYNMITGGTVVGNIVNLVFDRVNPNIYHFTFTGTLVGNVLSGMMDGPYLFEATGTVTP